MARYESYQIHGCLPIGKEPPWSPADQVLVPTPGDYRWVPFDDPDAAGVMESADAGREIGGYDGHRVAGFRAVREGD